MNKQPPEEDYFNETHRSLCKLFGAKFRSDWKNHEVACERWFDEGFRFDLTSFTFQVHLHIDPISHLTNTDFKQSFARLENALERVRKELKSNAIKPLLQEIDLGDYSYEEQGESLVTFHEKHEKHFSSQFKLSIEKLLREIEIAKFSQAGNIWKKEAKTNSPRPLERDLAYKLIEKYYLQYEKLPFASGSTVEANSLLLNATNEIFSIRGLSEDSRAACRDALKYSKNLFRIA